MNGRRFSLTPPPLPPPNALPPPPPRPPPKRIALQLGNQLQKTFQAKYSKVMDQEQCSVTPYTTDTDFASWSAYIDGESLQSTSDLFKKETALAGTHLRLLQRFGTPSTRSLEYSFNTVKDGEKVDLFFVYQNRTSASGEQLEEFLSPLHDVQKGRFIYQRYPSYSLCSVLLLGLKVLAPCTPREVIIAEYGPQWREPIAKWDYTSSPVNFVPQGWQRWSSLAASNETQYESF